MGEAALSKSVVYAALAGNLLVAATKFIASADELRTTEIEAAVIRLEDRIRKKHPEVIAVFIKPQTRRSFEQMRAGRRSDTGGTA
ncbi:MAG: hypothetical protein JSS54_05375 [Proteobacteria bacterium]|nr:hypothetical protein [Pseudomonadota bacterium]